MSFYKNELFYRQCINSFFFAEGRLISIRWKIAPKKNSGNAYFLISKQRRCLVWLIWPHKHTVSTNKRYHKTQEIAWKFFCRVLSSSNLKEEVHPDYPGLQAMVSPSMIHGSPCRESFHDHSKISFMDDLRWKAMVPWLIMNEKPWCNGLPWMKSYALYSSIP